MRPYRTIIAVTLIAAMAASCFLTASCEKRERDPGVLRMSLETEPPTLDWSMATDNWSIHVINNIMRGLTRYDEDMVARPELAQSWNVSDDGMVYTFHLRGDVRWTDGVPLTAQQFVDGWRRLLDPATAGEYAYFLYDVEGARDFNDGTITDFSKVGVKALDHHTLEVRLNKPVVYFPDVVTFTCTFPIRLDVVEKHGGLWTEPENIQTLGAYRLTRWRHEYVMDVEPFEGFYGPRPSIKKVEMFMVRQENTQLDLYDTGDLDIIRIPAHAIPYYKGRPGYREGPAYWMLYFGFNVKKPPFDKVGVRRAFAHAIDREQIVKIMQGGREPWSGWIPPRMEGANPDAGCKFDLDKARAFLAGAGYQNPGDFPDTVISYNSNLTNAMVFTNVQEQIRKHLGIEARLENMEWKVYLSLLYQDAPQIFRLAWMADYADPDNFMRMFISSSGNNHTNWGNPEYDRIIEEAAVERDPGKRRALYDRAQEILLVEDCVIVPLFVTQVTRLVSPRIKGYKVNPMDLIFLERLSIDDENPERP